MRNFIRSVVIIPLLFHSMISGGQALRQSVLAEGDWYEVAVDHDGVYKINAQMLTSMGIATNTLDPQKIQLWGNPSGMLPQANAANRPVDLNELAIYVHGESDGNFGSDDYILFYGNGPVVISFNPDTNEPEYQKHYYEEQTSYYLTIGDNNGKRIESIPNASGDFPLLNSTYQTRVHEQDLENRVISGREWYEYLLPEEKNTFGFSFPGRRTDSTVYIRSHAMAFGYSDTNISLQANQLTIGQHEISAVPEGPYASKGRDQLSDFASVLPSDVNADTIILAYSYVKNSAEARGYLDYVQVSTSCTLGLFGTQSSFLIPSGSHTVEVANTSGSELVWKVDDPLEVIAYEFDVQNSIQFGITSDEPNRFVVLDPLRVSRQPTYIGRVPNQDLQGMGAANLIIISYPGFVEEAERLADLRRSHDGLTVHVVTPEMIYHEFSSGMTDVTAIRDYLRYVYLLDNSERGLQYVLFFGKGTYNFKGPLNVSRNYVPIYESRNSLHPIYSYASDDFFGLMEESEGEWVEAASGDETMELGIGRLPVKSLEEARNVVDKYMAYANGSNSFGAWRNQITFVADDGDNNLHLRQADRLVDTVSTKNKALNPRKIYVDAFEQETFTAAQRAESVNKRITESIDQGTLIMNYTGHGNERQWASERILDLPMIDSWDNAVRLPLFITATCEFGRHDDPSRESGGEHIILRPDGGAIALVTTARPVFASQNFELNNAFYQSILAPESQGKRLGDVFRETKNNSFAGSVNRNFSLLGDPTLKLSFPENTIQFDQINGNAVDQDTLSAQEAIVMTGSIRQPSGNLIDNFQGVVQVQVFEKPSQKETLGDENPSYQYSDTDNIVFKGNATVIDGTFSFSFIMPKDITYNYGFGKISGYAYSTDLNTDAGGGLDNVVIGGIAPAPVVDAESPEISLYMQDTTFRPGQVVKPNTLLLAKFYDESGISLSNADPGQTLQAILDDTIVYQLSEYYVADVDSYQRGTVQLPLKNLAQGPHRMVVKARDTHNNPGEADLTFIVSERGQLVIENLRNYPNPMLDHTTFRFEHNRSGEELEVTLQIYDGNGGLVKETEYSIFSAFARVDGLEWSGTNSSGAKLRQGLYYYKVFVRSRQDGASAQQFQKLVIY